MDLNRVCLFFRSFKDSGACEEQKQVSFPTSSKPKNDRKVLYQIVDIPMLGISILLIRSLGHSLLLFIRT